MIGKLFLLAVKLCLSASIVTGVVLLLRLVFKKAPRGLVCALWALVALRLLIPVLPSSRVSVIPEAVSGGKAVEALQSQVVEETVAVREDRDEALYKEITVKYRELPVYQEAGQNYVVVSALAHTPPKTFGESVVPGLSVVWIIGIGIMLLYMIGSFWNLHRRLRTAVIREKGVWESDEITSPFILGVIRPRIYLPTSLTDEERAFVLAHEKTHLKRGDQIWKPLGYLLLALYWFNPLFWLAYFLVCRDIEGACDERVIKNEGPAYRKTYSETLLKLNVRQKAVAACPLAFSENGVGGRIRSVLNYRKPAFWLIVTALVISIVAAGCALTDPAKKSTAPGTESAEQPGASLISQSGKYHLVRDGQVLNDSLRFDFEKMTFYFDVWYASGREWYQGGMFIENGLLYAVDNSGYIPDGFVPDRADMEKRISDPDNARFVFRIVDGRTLEYVASGSDPLELNNRSIVDKDVLVLREEAIIGGLGDIARQKLEASFPFDEHGGPIYPDDYAGNYPDGKNLVLCLKDPDEAMIRRYLEIVTGFEDSVHIKAVRYSYNELQEMLRETAQELLAEKIQVNLYSVDVENNGIMIGVSEAFAETVRARLSEKYPEIHSTVTAVGPFYFDSPETGSEEPSPDGDQGGTPLINSDTVLGTYTYADGIIRDYIGEWGETRYFVLQIRDSEEEYSFAVGTVPKDREGGPVTLLSYLGRYNAVNYDNVSKMINGTAYVATDQGIFTVTQDGTVERIISGENFRTYPTVGDALLYSYWVVNGDLWTTYLEAYFPQWGGQTVRYLTLENKASQSGGDGYIVTASALDDGIYYVLSRSITQEVWYQPWRGVEETATGAPEEAKLIEKLNVPGIDYVAGNEHFYFLVTEATTNEPKIRLTFLDEPVESTVVKIESGLYSPLRAALARTGSWRFTNQYMWFDVNVNKRACTVYKIGEESIMPGWNLLARTPRSEEIILQSEDGSRMLFAQDETDFVDFEAEPAEDVRAVQARRGDTEEKARRLGLGAELEEAGSHPVFRLDSDKDRELFLTIFYEDRLPAEGNNEIKGLEEGMSAYGSEFFRDHVLYVIYDCFGPSGLKEEWFRVGCLVRNRTMHLRTGIAVPQGTGLRADIACYWVFVPVERSRTADVIAWDAIPASGSSLPDWTAPVNPDWRDGILDVPIGGGN